MFFSLFLHIKISRGLPPCAAAIWYHANAVNRGSTCGRIVSLLIGKNCEKTCKNVGSPGESARKHDVFENSGFVSVQNSAKTRKEHTATFRPGAQSVRSTVIVSMKSWRVMGEVLYREIAFRCLEVVLAKSRGSVAWVMHCSRPQRGGESW